MCNNVIHFYIYNFATLLSVVKIVAAIFVFVIVASCCALSSQWPLNLSFTAASLHKVPKIHTYLHTLCVQRYCTVLQEKIIQLWISAALLWRHWWQLLANNMVLSANSVCVCVCACWCVVNSLVEFMLRYANKK